ncbi:MAG: arginine deiminase family protein, partial [Peptidiphaga sp.]
MAFREIRIVGDPVLRTPCAPITQITPGVRTLVEDLLENVDEDGRAGLAANQIGVSLRAFSWNIEGGDIMPIGKGIVLVGMGERST